MKEPIGENTTMAANEATVAKLSDERADTITDRVTGLLKAEGMDLELLVFFDPVTEVLHAVGFDGAPERYFKGLEKKAPSPSAPAQGGA